jgi:hypothetical protein
MQFENETIDSAKEAARYLGIDSWRFYKLLEANRITPLENTDRYLKRDLDNAAMQIHREAEALRTQRAAIGADVDLLDGRSEAE